MNRQYIGARYVPKFFEGTNGTDWESGVAYEPLTIVTYLGNSYTSKIPVPASVGSPNNNPTYWASTGIYSAQIEEYREEVQEYKEDVDKLTLNETGDILMVFDSYGSTYGNEEGDFTTIPSVMQTLTSRAIRSVVVPGGGFVRDTGEGTFYSNLVTYLSSTSNLQNISDVYVCAGRNDWTASKAELKSAVEQFYNYCSTNLPNLKHKRFGYISNGDDSAVHGTKAQQNTCYKYLKEICNEINIEWTNGVSSILHDYNLLASDGVHPTAEGKRQLAYGIIQSIFGEFSCSYSEYKDITLTPVTGVTIDYSSNNMTSVLIDDIVTILPTVLLSITLPNAISQSTETNSLFSVSGSYVRYPVGKVVLPYEVNYVKDNKPTKIPGCVYLDHDGIVKVDTYAPAGIRSDNIQSLTLSGIGTVSIPALLS